MSSRPGTGRIEPRYRPAAGTLNKELGGAVGIGGTAGGEVLPDGDRGGISVDRSEESLRRVEKITGKKVPFVKTELCNPHEVEALFANHPAIPPDGSLGVEGRRLLGTFCGKLLPAL